MLHNEKEEKRELLMLLISVEYRVKDKVHKDIVKLANADIAVWYFCG